MDGLRYFTGLFRRVRTILLKREVEIIGQCNVCGKCCSDIMIETDRGWLRTKRQYDKFCEENPGYERFEIIDRDEEGCLLFACSLQGEDNFCTCYENRLPVCRNYPTKSLYYQGGWLRPDCGFSFKPTTFRDIYKRRMKGKIPKFSDILRQEQEQSDK